MFHFEVMLKMSCNELVFLKLSIHHVLGNILVSMYPIQNDDVRACILHNCVLRLVLKDIVSNRKT